MKRIARLSPLFLAVALAACGGGADNGTAAKGEPVAAVPAPAGKSWTDTVSMTPEGGVRMGNPNAPIKLVEFASLTCPHCADFAEHGFPALRDTYVASGKVSLELRNYVRDPLDLTQSLIARCAGAEPFFPLVDQLFATQAATFQKAQAMGEASYQATMSAPPEQRFQKLASAVGLIDFARQRGISEDQANACLADVKQADALAKGVEAANSQYKITGTPSFIINGTLLENVATWPALEAKLREAGA